MNINDLNYSGREDYKEEEILDEILDNVKQCDVTEYDKIIKEKKRWEVLYYLSSNRANIIEWMESDKNAAVLEISSECGAITEKLAEKYKKVTCIEVSKKKSLINALRNEKKENVEIYVGSYTDTEQDLENEKYDIITLIGALEKTATYTESKNVQMFLASLKKHLKPNGRVVIALENRFGLKYWAGCAEDYQGTIYGGLEGYLGENESPVYTKKSLETLIGESGYEIENFYYPYPDYKLPTTIYSDSYLPRIGELNNNYNHFDRDRIVTFDESKVFDSVIQEGEFSTYANSFLVIIKEGK